MENRYEARGVSASKTDVHKAIKNLDKGLFPNAFCRIYPDIWGKDPEFCNLMHADGAGTKSVLAYLYWKQTGDLSVWKGIAIDSIVMNLDDLLCVGAVGPFTYSSTIGRNKLLIPGEVLETIINGTQEYFDFLKSFGIEITLMGGETADVGDVVRTIIVDGTMACRMKRDRLMTCEKIIEGDVVVSLSSCGKSVYESEYNSGIGSNGLTSARHELLKKQYATLHPESVDNNLPESAIYTGQFDLTDDTETPLNIGKMLLSPTRTYAPLILEILEKHFDQVHGIVHCSGGGQSKCLHYLPSEKRVVKNNLLPIPPIFKLIQQSANMAWKEMYQVFNMGQRMEIYTDKDTAFEIVKISERYGVDAQITGFVEESDRKQVVIDSPNGKFVYE